MHRPDFNVPWMGHSSEQQPGDLSSLTPWRASFREAGARLCVLHLVQPFTQGAVKQVPLPFPGAEKQADSRHTVWCVLWVLWGCTEGSLAKSGGQGGEWIQQDFSTEATA